MAIDGISAHKEEVEVTKLTRATEYATVTIAGSTRFLPILGLRGSVTGNITAKIIVVSSFEELQQTRNARLSRGRIVVFNPTWVNFTQSNAYVRFGPSFAASVGAVGCLVKSPTPYSLYTIHAGMVEYSKDKDIPNIPSATITVEDATMFHGLYNSKKDVLINLYLGEQTTSTVTSHNLVAELKGFDDEKEKAVVFSVSIGQGVQELAGFVMGWEALRAMKQLNVIPARTIRLVGLTGERTGHEGELAYIAKYGSQTEFMLEAREGVSQVLGIRVSVWKSTAFALLSGIGEVLELAEHAGSVVHAEEASHDVSPFRNAGIPSATLMMENGQDIFYWYRHSGADSTDKIFPKHLIDASAVFAAYGYCIADLKDDIPGKD
eukprot:TRINITY_DN6334_c0_g1_i2.p1 TRINITY_DN6334_c0_g1~~TRINITY_DN6334_c0_g1_i2.p1  ORF type:complete len:378 (-),score=91.36 TRINITY_DN6334_c0_g1_i2:494-1627(-)